MKIWQGSKPNKCDICMVPLDNRHLTQLRHAIQKPSVFVDGATKMGPWAIMCRGCHRSHGRRLGTGKGQEYTLNVDTEQWEKTAG